MAKNTRITVTVCYEVEYDGKVTEDDIDINDIIRMAPYINSGWPMKWERTRRIKDIKIKTKSVRG